MLSLRCRINANVPELLVIIGEAPRRASEELERDSPHRYTYLPSFLAVTPFAPFLPPLMGDASLPTRCSVSPLSLFPSHSLSLSLALGRSRGLRFRYPSGENISGTGAHVYKDDDVARRCVRSYGSFRGRSRLRRTISRLRLRAERGGCIAK